MASDDWAHCFDGSLAKRHVNTANCADPRPRRDCPFCGSGLGEHDHLLTGGSEARPMTRPDQKSEPADRGRDTTTPKEGAL